MFIIRYMERPNFQGVPNVQIFLTHGLKSHFTTTFNTTMDSEKKDMLWWNAHGMWCNKLLQLLGKGKIISKLMNNNNLPCMIA